jgi:light-regulated signal transduction histidine kinase (bacteriophytochrome)
MMGNKELDQNLIQLKNKNKELAQFTYIASHDLQEPLRTVMNFTDLFEQQYKDQLDEQASTYLNFISQASNRMSNLIKGLLDYSRIGHSKKRTNIDVNEVLTELQQDLHSTIEETGTRIDIGLLPQVKGFKVELRLLFQNLILNAIKFRKEKVTPEIEITASDKVDFYEFSIRDNGIGIAKEYQEKIFSIFQRLHTQKQYEGTGIGLAHCQKIVELHQGTISVSSVPDQGSKFIFTILKC